MLTCEEKVRAARMYAISDIKALLEQVGPMPGTTSAFNELMLKYAAGECDHYYPIAQAIRVLNRVRSGGPRDHGRVHNAVHALQYLRGYFAPFDAISEHNRRPAEYRHGAIGSAWSTGYFMAHSSDRYYA